MTDAPAAPKALSADARARMEELNGAAAHLNIWLRTQANAPAQRPWFTDTDIRAHGELSAGRVGAGQMSRLDSSFIAAFKSNDRAKGGVCASDAFFPFRDGIDQIHKAGIAAVIQPGGSKRDDEVIAACNDYGIAMIFTGQRHFRH